MADRAAVPDESHPTILLATQGGVQVRLTKLGNDKHSDFDPVYDYLLTLCKPAGAPISEGPLDWKWRPVGFTAP